MIRRLCAVAAFVGLPFIGSSVAADPEATIISEAQIKAAFLYNFTKFVEWPAESFASASDPIVIGLLGESPLTAALEAIVEDRRVNGRVIVVRDVRTASDIDAIQMLFVSEEQDARFTELQAVIRYSSVLTVGESSAFSTAGGAIRFIQERGKLRFEINMLSAERARLKVSAQLQKLATVVRRTP